MDGTGLERITNDPSGFNAFPMFSRDGKRIAFSSNRNGSKPHETNVFVAEWAPEPHGGEESVAAPIRPATHMSTGS